MKIDRKNLKKKKLNMPGIPLVAVIPLKKKRKIVAEIIELTSPIITLVLSSIGLLYIQII